MNTYILEDGRERWTHVEVGAWIPDSRTVGLTLSEAIDVAERADEFQRAAHGTEEAIRDCCAGDCWCDHLNDAVTEHDNAREEREIERQQDYLTEESTAALRAENEREADAWIARIEARDR